MKKKLIIAGVVLVVLAIVAVFSATFFLGSLVKTGFEKVGPKITQVEMKLDSADISVFSGKGSLKGLLIGNPPEFKSPSAISVGEVSIDIEPKSVLSDKVVVHSVQVIAPKVTLHKLTGDNLKKILANIQASTGGTNATAKKTEATEGTKKLQVDDILIKDGKLEVILPLVGSVPLNLPEIHITKLGQGPEGITSAEVSEIVISKLLDVALLVAKNAPEITKKATDEVKKQTEKVNEIIGKGTNKITESIGNLLKKK